MKAVKGFLDYIKKNKKWIYPVIIFVAAAAAIVPVYYFKVYLVEPNFSDERFNYVYSDADESVKPGSEITYVINYMNTGNRDVNSLVIEVEVPEHTSFVSSDREDILTTDDNNKLSFNIGEVKKNQKGKLFFTVKVDSPLDKGTLIRPGDMEFNYRIGEEVFSKDITAGAASEIESSPDLSSFKIEVLDENGEIIKLGDVIKYNLIVKNTGDMGASDIEIKSSISEYVDIIEDSVSDSGEYDSGHVLWKIENIKADETKVVSFKVRVKEDLSGEELITSKATLKYGSEIIEKTAEEKLNLFSDLSTSEAYIYDANGGELYPGETINIKVIVRNTGDKKEESYSIICPTPEGATYISRSGTAEGIKWSDDIRGLIWDLNNLAAGEEKEITFKIKVNEELAGSGGTITTNFRIEDSSGVIELPSKSLGVRGNVGVTVVAMGDSLIARSNWVQIFDGLLEANYPYAEYNTVPSAKNGEMARDGYARFDSTVAVHNPNIIIIAYGTNDVGSRASGFSGYMEGLMIKAKSTGARVFVNLIGPIYWPDKENYAEYNNVIRQLAANHGIVVIDVFTPLSQNPGAYLSDGVHYSSAGASVVAHTVFSYVSGYLGSIGQRL